MIDDNGLGENRGDDNLSHVSCPIFVDGVVVDGRKSRSYANAERHHGSMMTVSRAPKGALQDIVCSTDRSGRDDDR